jgi:hypothetical protein
MADTAWPGRALPTLTDCCIRDRTAISPGCSLRYEPAAPSASAETCSADETSMSGATPTSLPCAESASVEAVSRGAFGWLALADG